MKKLFARKNFRTGIRMALTAGYFFCILPYAAYAEELRILCWEGYADSEYTQNFEKMVKEKHGTDLKITVCPTFCTKTMETGDMKKSEGLILL